MTSSFFTNPHPQNFLLPNQQQYHQQYATPQASYLNNDGIIYDETAIITHALALLPTTNGCMNNLYAASNPNISLQLSTPEYLPPEYDARQDSVISTGFTPSVHDWQMYQASMGGPIASTRRPLKRARSHQRTPSASTVASNGPASPYTSNTSYPHIANTDFSPNSPAHYTDQALFAKNIPTPQQTPTDGSFMNSGYNPNQVSHTPNAHLAMKGFAIDHHLSDDFAPEYVQSSRQSLSSGHDSPATPQSGAGDQQDYRNFNMSQNDFNNRQPNPNVQLFRTESSQAYQDELYNPQAFTNTPTSAAKSRSDLLSPHRNLVSERLQTANLARSASPTSGVSRERSPFRDGSPLAPAGDWSSNVHNVGTAAGMRQQQKEEAAQAEYAHHAASLQREPTKTISPKDAMLDYNETEQPSLFQDSIPAGYRQHTGGPEAWQGNSFANHSTPTFGEISAGIPTQQQMAPFRATSADGWSEANFGSYMHLPPNSQGTSTQIQGMPFQTTSAMASRMSYSEAPPDFPATLTSMESSVSEGGPPPSSQESYNNPGTQQRPSDTRANTGTYTCTYHGCTQRFDSHINLQKHKRDYHRSQQHKESTSTESESTSARSTESPAPSSASGMTSAAILARNSQAGPHKCTRINPSTNKPCNTIFSRPYDLTRHEDTIHNGRKQKVKCPFCREEKTFSRNDALTRHMRVVHPDVESFGKRSRRGD